MTFTPLAHLALTLNLAAARIGRSKGLELASCLVHLTYEYVVSAQIYVPAGWSIRRGTTLRYERV